MDMTGRPIIDAEHAQLLATAEDGVVIVRLPYVPTHEVLALCASIEQGLREAGLTQPLVMLPHGVMLEQVLRNDLDWVPRGEETSARIVEKVAVRDATGLPTPIVADVAYKAGDKRKAKGEA